MQYEILEDEFVGIRIDKYLNEINEDYTRSFVQKMIEEGNVTVNGKTVKASYKLKKNDVIDIEEIENTELEVEAEDIPLDIVYEDEDLIIVNKAKGMVVHPGNGNYTGTLVNALLFTHKDRLSAIGSILKTIDFILKRITGRDNNHVLSFAQFAQMLQQIQAATIGEHDIQQNTIVIVASKFDIRFREGRCILYHIALLLQCTKHDFTQGGIVFHY